MFEPLEKNKKYRPCVGICLFNDEGKVFVAERIDAPGSWQMPQGGLDEGEDPFACAMRELKEEIGTNNAEYKGRLDDWLYYDLPKELSKKVWHGKYRGQKQIWFAFKYKGTDDDINLQYHHPEFQAFKWVSLEESVELIIDFKREIYQEIATHFAKFA